VTIALDARHVMNLQESDPYGARAPRLERTLVAPAPAALARPGEARLVVAGVTARFGAITAVDRVSLEVAAGEIVCLLGPSGSGKSTLLRLVAGLERPSSGRILLDGVEVAGPQTFVEPEQRRAGMVFQDYALFPHLTIAANVAFGLRGRRSREEIDRTVGPLLDRLDLRRYERSYPHMLSGGERQRVALARALAPAPRLLLMDEPFSSLDDRLRDRVRDETVRVLRETQTTTIVVTHDPGEALCMADRIVLLQEGQVVQVGTPAEVYVRPATLCAARFFSDVNELHGVSIDGQVVTPIGRFEAPGLAEQAAACVCVRPQHLRLSGVPTPVAGRVVHTTFLGEAARIEVAVPGLAAPLTVRSFGRVRLAAGDDAYLDIDPQDVIVFPAQPSSNGVSACREVC
jgi:iron(III) transport system ATP-binding protein